MSTTLGKFVSTYDNANADSAAKDEQVRAVTQQLTEGQKAAEDARVVREKTKKATTALVTKVGIARIGDRILQVFNGELQDHTPPDLSSLPVDIQDDGQGGYVVKVGDEVPPDETPEPADNGGTTPPDNGGEPGGLDNSATPAPENGLDTTGFDANGNQETPA